MTTNALIAARNDELRRTLAGLLRGEGFQAREAGDSGECVALVMELNPRIVLMAEDMPSLEGVGCLPLVRRLTRAPIIVVGLGGEVPVVRALLQGADMYVAEPFNAPELVGRVRAVLRRGAPDTDLSGAWMTHSSHRDFIPSMRTWIARFGQVMAASVASSLGRSSARRGGTVMGVGHGLAPSEDPLRFPSRQPRNRVGRFPRREACPRMG